MGTSRSHGVIGLRYVAGGASFSRGQVEALKWIALSAMLAGHFNRYVIELTSPSLYVYGRLAFPLFALALGLALTRPGVDFHAHERVAFRLAPFAVVAQVALIALGAGGALNVLFLYIAAAAWRAVTPGRPGGLWHVELLVVRGCALLVAFFAEFSLPGFLFVLCLWNWCASRTDRNFLIVLSALALSCFFEQSYWAFMAAPVAAIVHYLRLELPRWRGIFAWAYCAQFAVLGALVWGT